MAISIRRDNDPFKKYWWVLLLVFGLGAAWICLPAMQKANSGGSERGEASLMKSSDGQSLYSKHNPSGAPGGVIDLSMDGAGVHAKNAGDAPLDASIQQGTESAAPGAPLAGGAAAAPSFAAALKDVGNAAKTPGGWNEKAQKGFKAPAAQFGGLSGLGGSGGGSSSAGAGSFGTRIAEPGVVKAGGFNAPASAAVDPGKLQSLKSLKTTSKNSTAGAVQQNFAAASDTSGRTFDGTPGGKSNLASGAGSDLAALDASQAPINLKQSDIKKPKDVEGKKVEKKKDDKEDDNEDEEEDEDIATSLLKKVVDIFVGGLSDAFVGSMMGDGSKSDQNAQRNNSQGG